MTENEGTYSGNIKTGSKIHKKRRKKKKMDVYRHHQLYERIIKNKNYNNKCTRLSKKIKSKCKKVKEN